MRAMRIWQAGWFYTKLILANLQFLSWFFWQQYFVSRILGISVVWLALAIFLVTRQITAWNTPDFTVTPIWPAAHISTAPPLNWQRSNTPQLNQLCEKLAHAHQEYPTHRDILINLSLCKMAQNQPTASQNFWQMAQKLDPNAQIFK